MRKNKFLIVLLLISIPLSIYAAQGRLPLTHQTAQTVSGVDETGEMRLNGLALHRQLMMEMVRAVISMQTVFVQQLIQETMFATMTKCLD